uniref:Uncharacterized protein n=1 Tax=Panagrolaimus sp. ES5 TaxID=591445 RepID=A0AC34GHR4_9BILA
AGQEENPKNLFKAGAHSSMMVLPLLSTTAASSYNQRTALTAGN